MPCKNISSPSYPVNQLLIRQFSIRERTITDVVNSLADFRSDDLIFAQNKERVDV